MLFSQRPRHQSSSRGRHAEIVREIQVRAYVESHAREFEQASVVDHPRQEEKSHPQLGAPEKQETAPCNKCGKPVILRPPEKAENGRIFQIGICQECGGRAFKELAPATRKRFDVHVDCQRGPNQVCTADPKGKKFCCTGCGELIDFGDERVKLMWIDLPLVQVSQIHT
jgi:hypothetical protein